MWNVQCTDGKEQDHAERGYQLAATTPVEKVSYEMDSDGGCEMDGIGDRCAATAMNHKKFDDGSP